MVRPIALTEVVLAGLLGLLGVAALVHFRSARSGVLMPLYFVAALVYAVYVYLNTALGYILASIVVLSVVGLILGFGSRAVSRAAVPKTAQAGRVASMPSPKRAVRKKSSGKSAAKRKK